MDKYELVNQIGDGTFGSVIKAVLKKTGQLVAVKKMKQKFYTWEECVKLPEVDVVRRIHGHPNIVKLREVIRENNELFFVFEYMDGDLLNVIKKSKQGGGSGNGQSSPCIPYPQIKSYMRQVLQALAYIHKRGYFHRDLKPENLLIRKEPSGEEVLKLADFGLVKEIRSRPPFTDYVSTRWYRAPELLLQDRFYSSPVDIWAAGCIMAELITTRPLFPGTNEVDQLFRIMSVLSAPTEKSWPGGIHLAKKIRYTFPSITGTGLAQVMPAHTPTTAVDLLNQMLTYDPKQRPTAEQCLQHPFFTAAGDGCGELSAAALDQLAFAAKRLQPGSKTAPPPLKVPAVAPLALPKAGRATADGSVPLGGSPRDHYSLPKPMEATPPLKSIVSPTAIALPAVSAEAHSKTTLPIAPQKSAAATGVEPVSLPPVFNHISATKRRSQDASGTSLAKKLAGLKNAHIGNGKVFPMYSTSTTKAAQSSASASASATTGMSTSVVSALPSTQLSAKAGSVGSGLLGNRETKPLKMNMAQPMRRSITKETEAQLPMTLSVSKRDVSLDELMEEFALEMSHLSAQAERRSSNTKASDVVGEPSLTQDSVAALLGNSRFKKTATVAKEPSLLQPLKGIGTTRTTFLQKPRKSEDLTTVTELPRVEHPTRSVSPSLKALLAKHKTSAFAHQ